jgi:hypothetical protein
MNIVNDFCKDAGINGGKSGSERRIGYAGIADRDDGEPVIVALERHSNMAT